MPLARRIVYASEGGIVGVNFAMVSPMHVRAIVAECCCCSIGESCCHNWRTLLPQLAKVVATQVTLSLSHVYHANNWSMHIHIILIRTNNKSSSSSSSPSSQPSSIYPSSSIHHQSSIHHHLFIHHHTSIHPATAIYNSIIIHPFSINHPSITIHPSMMIFPNCDLPCKCNPLGPNQKNILQTYIMMSMMMMMMMVTMMMVNVMAMLQANYLNLVRNT